MKKYIKYFQRLLQMSLVIIVISSCTKDDDGEKPVVNQRDFSVADYLTAGNNTLAANYNTLYAALEKAGMLSTLESGTFTLLAPTDDAFAAAGIKVDDVSADDLATILNYHLIASEIASDGLSGRIATVNGASVSVSNGVVDGIANATYEIDLSNGALFQLDAVLTPPVGNVLAVLAANSNLTFAAYAFEKSSISLSGTANLTVFAPDNDVMAGAGLDSAGIDAATEAALDATLKYHVVQADLYSSALESQIYETLAGPVTETPGLEVVVDEPIEVDGKEITSANLPATNGVVHVVDGILTRPYFTNESFAGLSGYWGFWYGQGIDSFLASMQRVGLDATYIPAFDGANAATLEAAPYSFIVPTDFTPAGFTGAEIIESNYPVDADLIDILESYIFEGNIDWYANASVGGTVYTSVNGTRIVATLNDDDAYLNGSVIDLFGGEVESLNNGSVMTTMGLITPLSDDDLVTELDSEGYTLFSAAVDALGATATGDYTVFAINDSSFTASYGTDYDTPAEIAADTIPEVTFASILNHIVDGWYFGIDVDERTVDEYTAVNGVVLPFTSVSNGLGIGFLVDPSNAGLTLTAIMALEIETASNGVIHEVDALIDHSPE